MEFNNVWRSVEHSNETIKITWRFWHFHESSSKSQYYLKKEKKTKEKTKLKRKKQKPNVNISNLLQELVQLKF